MKATGDVPWAIQLGNEGGNGIAKLDGAAAARAFIKLDDAVGRVWNGTDRQNRPRIMGPDGGDPETYLPEFWNTLVQAKQERLLAAFSYHTYVLARWRCLESSLVPRVESPIK